MLPPLPADSLQVVSTDSLKAALVKLNIKVPFEDVISAIHEVEKTKRDQLITQATQRRATLSKLALQPPKQHAGLQFTTSSQFIPRPPKPGNADPLAKERRRRLLELTKQTFPDGKVPDPFALTWLALSQDAAANRLPFIQATRIVVTSAEDESNNPPQTVFQDAWCLWDTGAQTAFVATSLLDPVVRNHKDQGSAIMQSRVTKTVDSVIHFRPTLPNGVTFIILGQHALINRLQYQIQPTAINPKLAQGFPEAYGQINLVSWCDPVGDQVVLL